MGVEEGSSREVARRVYKCVDNAPSYSKEVRENVLFTSCGKYFACVSCCVVPCVPCHPISSHSRRLMCWAVSCGVFSCFGMTCGVVSLYLITCHVVSCRPCEVRVGVERRDNVWCPCKFRDSLAQLGWRNPDAFPIRLQQARSLSSFPFQSHLHTALVYDMIDG